MNYDPHKKYRRVGECRRCGRCCDLHCQYLRWIVIRDIKAGEVFADTGKDKGYLYAECLIFNEPIMSGSCNLEQRQGFPFNPWQTPPKCGYSWVEV